jgi:hypothetical protein
MPMPDLSAWAASMGVRPKVLRAAWDRLVAGGYIAVNVTERIERVTRLQWVDCDVVRRDRAVLLHFDRVPPSQREEIA